MNKRCAQSLGIGLVWMLLGLGICALISDNLDGMNFHDIPWQFIWITASLVGVIGATMGGSE